MFFLLLFLVLNSTRLEDVEEVKCNMNEEDFEVLSAEQSEQLQTVKCLVGEAAEAFMLNPREELLVDLGAQGKPHLRNSSAGNKLINLVEPFVRMDSPEDVYQSYGLMYVSFFFSFFFFLLSYLFLMF